MGKSISSNYSISAFGFIVYLSDQNWLPFRPSFVCVWERERIEEQCLHANKRHVEQHTHTHRVE
jgi:hypothetical protein